LLSPKRKKCWTKENGQTTEKKKKPAKACEEGPLKKEKEAQKRKKKHPGALRGSMVA